MRPPIRKYPRTQHIQGSRLQPGDHDLSAVPFPELLGRQLVVEEKIDGANSAVSFDERGKLLLQSRGHYLTGGPRERHFALLKTWAHTHAGAMQRVLGDRYVMYGEWVYALHTVFYDRLPHYFLEFDVLDRQSEAWLSTERRRSLLAGLPVASVPVLAEGQLASLKRLTHLIGPSSFKTDRWREQLTQAALESGEDPVRVSARTDPSDAMEGLYIKVEEDGQVLARYKWVRAGFLQAVQQSGGHWLDRPIVPNALASGVSLF